MARRGEQTTYRRTTYEDGNTVRRYEEVPDYHREREQRREERRVSEQKRRRRRAARRNRERALSMSAGYVSFLTGCVLAVAVTAVLYINLQSDITIRQNQMAALESEISVLKIDNDTTYKRIVTSVNLNQIKKQAKKLGMRYPTEEQIVYYTVDNSDHMTQYSDVMED